ncbi:MAG TPA: SUMF1/EgtB/PvdO family nonheme iron enzyme [Spirochaetia bacterium]|nr:SUMF1/EgtB/PvdO family nonheme iron enzyme [Spirochaetia bacterium]
MSKKDRNEPPSTAADAGVRLKPVLGVRPGQYLTVIYAVVLVLAVYLLLFVPGLRHRGAYLSLQSFPEHAAVTVDGRYAGSTPCTVFLPHGSRTVMVSRPFYTAVTLTRKVAGRVFATLLVPDRSRASVSLDVADVNGLAAGALADFQKNPQIPQIVSQAAWAAAANSRDPLYDLVARSLLVTTDESQLREILVAAGRVSARTGFLTAGSLLDMVQRAAAFAESADNAPAWLLLTLSRANQTHIAASPWVQQYLSGYRDVLSRYYQPGAPVSGPAGGGPVVAGIAFRGIPGGDLVMGRDDELDTLGKTIDRLLAHPVRVAPFFLASSEVTNAEFQAFVAENPDWAPSNGAALIQKGVVTDTYLAQWKSGAPAAGTANTPVTSVSWYAAEAYCQWLTRRVQASLPGYQARLPSESEWEWAARGGLRGMPYPLGGKPGGAVFFSPGITGPSASGTSEPNGYGLRDMLGNVWEWCSDPFSLNASVLSSRDPKSSAQLEASLPDAPDRAVRGGSWADQPGADKVYTRGSQPAQWCTPYLGFRVALGRR